MDKPITTRMSITEYRQLPESNKHQEFIEGELFVAPAPKDDHQAVSAELLFVLRSIIGRRGQLRHQPTDLYLAPNVVLQPDIFWVNDENARCRLGEDGYWHGAPDLVVEILSPSTEARDRGLKFELYERHGVGEYWLVQPSAQFVEVFVHDGAQFQRQGIFDKEKRFISAVLDAEMNVAAFFPPY